MRRRWAVCAAGLGLFVGPLVLTNYQMDVLLQGFFLGALGLSLNLLVQFAGLPSLGHAAFFGIGAYAAGLLSVHWEVRNLWLALAVAVCAAALAGVVFGAVSLRTRGPAFLIITLSLSAMVWGLAVKWRSFTGGDDGLLGIRRMSVWPIPTQLDSRTKYYYAGLGGMVLVGAVTALVVRSPVGHILVGIRDSESRMEALGYPTWRYRLWAFVVAGSLAAVPGVLATSYNLFVSPSDAHFIGSARALLVVIIGGGTVWGPAVGAVALAWLEKLFTGWTDHWLALLGAVYVAAALFDPKRMVQLLFGARTPRQASASDRTSASEGDGAGRPATVEPVEVPT